MVLDSRHMKTLMTFALLLAVGCASETPAQDQTSAALTTWQSKGFATYSFTWKSDCECIDSGRQIRVSVANGAVTSALYLDNETPVGDDARGGLMTIEGIFAKVQDAYATNADLVDVRFDPSLGFPASVFVDYSGGIADEELSLTISDVR